MTESISVVETGQRRIIMGQSKHLGDDAYVHYLDCGDGLTDLELCQT